MRLPAVLILFVVFGLSQAKIKSSDPGPLTNCTLEETPVCGFKPHAGTRTVCTFLNICFFDEFALASPNGWRLQSNEPCQWPTRDCNRIMDEIWKPTPQVPARKVKKRRKQGTHKNSTKPHRTMVQKRHKAEVKFPVDKNLRRVLQDSFTRDLQMESTEAPINVQPWHLSPRKRDHHATKTTQHPYMKQEEIDLRKKLFV